MNALRVRQYPFCPAYPLASFGHVQNFKRTPPDKYVWCMNFTRALVCGLPCSHAVCPVLMRSASCRYPVCIRWCTFDLNCERSTTGQVTEIPRRVPHAHSMFVQRTCCPFLKRNIFVLSIIHPLHVRKLTILCQFLVRYVCAPYHFREDLHRHWDNFHHRINRFRIFSVRSASVTFIQ